MINNLSYDIEVLKRTQTDLENQLQASEDEIFSKENLVNSLTLEGSQLAQEIHEKAQEVIALRQGADALQAAHRGEIEDRGREQMALLRAEKEETQKERYRLILEKDLEMKNGLNDLRSQLIGKYQPEITRLKLEMEKMIGINQELLHTE